MPTEILRVYFQHLRKVRHIGCSQCGDKSLTLVVALSLYNPEQFVIAVVRSLSGFNRLQLTMADDVLGIELYQQPAVRIHLFRQSRAVSADQLLELRRRIHPYTHHACCDEYQGRRSIWDRGDTSPQYLDWGDIITNVPLNISRVISATFYPCNIFLIS